LLVAFTFNQTNNGVAAGWTKQVENSGGTDWGNICTKTAGASEPTTQQAMSTATANGGVVIYELHKGAGTPAYVYGVSQGEISDVQNQALVVPNAFNCLGISALSLVGTSVSYTSVLNFGTQDVLDNSGNRRMAAGHTDLSQTPTAGLLALLSALGSTKGCTGLFT
jgi:hypothetical protein